MVWGSARIRGVCRNDSKLAVDSEAEFAENRVQGIKSRFDCLDHSRIENRESVVLRIRRQRVR
jgi:hypothetical protein